MTEILNYKDIILIFKDLILSITPILTFFLAFRSFYSLKSKDQQELTLKLIEKSYSDGEKLLILLEEIHDAEGQEEKEKKFILFVYHLQHLCILILSKVVEENVLKYKYASVIRSIVENKYIENMHEELGLPFVKESYHYLFDAYKKVKKI